MKVTHPLWQNAVRLTLFTRANCSLCIDAENVLAKVWTRRQFEYKKIDVMEPGQEKWKNLYEFDTPVVHFDKSTGPFDTAANSLKLMHRFTQAQVEQMMDKLEES
ncbi:hypothetical protein M433DRAFT_156383 [Acidomyces richmondensis BFW]|nr:MAG: hypothetical protein FE78DRAFT_153547 [Acidomyces sp. 'richmondensis']KYG43725.1 hypothetical protein M433DRAFT_156383 [Acidomyces richmondensis BFW]